MDTKAYLMENQLLHQVKKLQERQKEIDRMVNADPREIPKDMYDKLSHRCDGGITQLLILLTCHDNPLSNFEAEQKKEKQKKK